jgi:hypothetical protein
MATQESIMQEIRGMVSELLDSGKTSIETREEIIERLQASVDMAYAQCFLEILLSPEAGLGFASATDESIMFTNEVLFTEFKIIPIHISEINSPVFDTIEQVFQMDVEEAIELYREGGLSYE